MGRNKEWALNLEFSLGTTVSADLTCLSGVCASSAGKGLGIAAGISTAIGLQFGCMAGIPGYTDRRWVFTPVWGFGASLSAGTVSKPVGLDLGLAMTASWIFGYTFYEASSPFGGISLEASAGDFAASADFGIPPFYPALVNKKLEIGPLKLDIKAPVSPWIENTWGGVSVGMGLLSTTTCTELKSEMESDGTGTGAFISPETELATGEARTCIPFPSHAQKLLGGGGCCDAACGTCGGEGCADRPGGRDKCCIMNILAAQKKCNTDANGTMTGPVHGEQGEACGTRPSGIKRRKVYHGSDGARTFGTSTSNVTETPVTELHGSLAGLGHDISLALAWGMGCRRWDAEGFAQCWEETGQALLDGAALLVGQQP